VVIDLGELASAGRPQVRAAAAARPPDLYRRVLFAITIVLAALLSGAAHIGPPAPPLIIPARLGDTTFVVGDRLFVVTGGPESPGGSMQKKIISTYALPAGALLSQTTVAVTGAIYDVAAAADTVLVSYQVSSFGAETTVAVAAGTDRAIWRRPARLLGVSPPDGLVVLRENSPGFGPLHWYGVDLAAQWVPPRPATRRRRTCQRSPRGLRLRGPGRSGEFAVFRQATPAAAVGMGVDCTAVSPSITEAM
jgi:hypothetical protein